MGNNQNEIVPANDNDNDIALPENHPVAVYLTKLSSSSSRVMITALNTIAKLIHEDADLWSIDWHLLRYQHTQALRAKLVEMNYSPRTVNRHLSALRGVLKESWRLGYMNADEYQRAIDIPNAEIDETEQSGRLITDAEFNALLDMCFEDYEHGNVSGLRDAAMLSLMYLTAPRRSEVSKLLMKDYNPADGSLQIVRSKRGKSRTVYIDGDGKKMLDAWIEIRGQRDGALFVAIDKHGNLNYNKIEESNIYHMLERRCVQADIKPVKPHDFRRTGITNALKVSDAISVSKWAGHSDVNTTRGYDMRKEEEKKKIAKRLKLPKRK